MFGARFFEVELFASFGGDSLFSAEFDARLRSVSLMAGAFPIFSANPTWELILAERRKAETA
jgi:hypothetical protein